LVCKQNENNTENNDKSAMKNCAFPQLSVSAACRSQRPPAAPHPSTVYPFRGVHAAHVASFNAERLQASALPDNDQKIDQSIAYMSNHLNEPLNVAKLASVANISSSHFFVVFKRRTGQAPIDYFIHLRMGQARRLLEETAMSVKDVASTLGYEDPFYFSRLFKSVNRLSPTDYRAQRQPTLRAA
jgi:AraC-like DNA-binding protein